MRYFTHHRSSVRPAIALMLACTLSYGLACSVPSDPDEGGQSLEGFLEAAVATDGGGGIPQPLSPQGEGYARGTFIGPSLPGAGNDSLLTAPRIAGATIRIHTIVGDPNAPDLKLGDEVASTTTDADGQFETPTLAGGQEYVLTFSPPAGSGYAAVWVRTMFFSQTHEWPWWVVAPKT